MVLPSDKEYKATKRIILGNAEVADDFKGLISYIKEQYGAKPVNVIYDSIPNASKGWTPRLQVCFEFQREAAIFKDNEGSYDQAKQKAIADKFSELVKSEKLGRKGFWTFITGNKYRTDGLFVCFSAFEPIAKMEANTRIPSKAIALLQQKLSNQALWTIVPIYNSVTFFVYTDEQLKQYEDNTEKKIWASAYFELLQQYDEFGYFKRETFGIQIDSKENFDNNYSSNWYYYFK